MKSNGVATLGTLTPLRETERRYEAGLEEPIDWDVAKQELRERRK